MKNLKILATLITGLLFATMTYAQPSPKDYKGKDGRSDKKICMRHYSGHHGAHTIPDLTDKQKEEMKKIRIATKKETTPLKLQVEEKEAKLKQLMIVDNADQEAINQMIESIYADKAAIKKKKAESRVATRNLLTEEQKVAYDSRSSSKRKYDCKGKRSRK